LHVLEKEHALYYHVLVKLGQVSMIWVGDFNDIAGTQCLQLILRVSLGSQRLHLGFIWKSSGYLHRLWGQRSKTGGVKETKGEVKVCSLEVVDKCLNLYNYKPP